VLLDTNDSQPNNASLNTLTYTPGISQNVNGTDTFFHTDWLGSTRHLSDSTGNSFPAALRCVWGGDEPAGAAAAELLPVWGRLGLSERVVGQL
jgi:hypothetical protein